MQVVQKAQLSADDAGTGEELADDDRVKKGREKKGL